MGVIRDGCGSVPATDHVSTLMSAEARNRGDEPNEPQPTPRFVDMRRYFSGPSLELFVIQFSVYFILTLNYRAIATINYAGTFVTDLIVAALSFTSIRRVAAVTTTAEDRVGYMLGGGCGALVALWLSTFLFPR